jgi:hypothetical protein
MSVVFFLNIENAKFNPMAISAATIIAVNTSAKTGWVVYVGVNPSCPIKESKFIIL